MSTKTKRCCGTSVGVLVLDSQGRPIMVTREWWPRGTAPVAGHVKDAHTDVMDALVAEVREESGLTVTSAEIVWKGHLPNLCASLPHEPTPGHAWEVGVATATGTITDAPGETRGVRAYEWEEVEDLARATLAHYRAGGTPATQPDASLEAVWLRLMWEAGFLGWLTDEDLALAETAYTTAPDTYWLGGRP